MLRGTNTRRISPTAYYTGHVWSRNGLSEPSLDTRAGLLMYAALEPWMRAASPIAGGVTLEQMLLQRHLIIDHLLARAIERKEIAQVLEIAGGLSGRGHRFARRYDITYVEGDLPAMIAQKRQRLSHAAQRAPSHHLVELNAMLNEGPRSIQSVAQTLLDPSKPTAIITEGLLSYFVPAQSRAIIARIERTLSGFPSGMFLTDSHVGAALDRSPLVRLFRAGLSALTGGAGHELYASEFDTRAGLDLMGFAKVHIHHVADFVGLLPIPAPGRLDTIHVIEAHTNAPSQAQLARVAGHSGHQFALSAKSGGVSPH